MNKDFQTDFLAATSTFVTEMGSVLNLSGEYFSYNRFATPGEADEAALKNDWAMAGQDIRVELEKLKRQAR